ncbi:MAG: amidohydrolase [Fimbriimonadaceae bacterium]|nr:amidohydrolase [Polyangiaceae bacterium]MCK6630834.1 amidohydrolase [Fimbriimonadaceae bacterium]NUM38330.1 amidohydrolase [Armatimonadota bacterium]
MSAVIEPTEPLIRAVLDLRHDLHAHPELAYQERRTSAVVERELAAAGVESVAGLAGGTGVLGWLPATDNPASAPTIALRADMDALPIHEATGKPYASQHEGVMHACGHDGHTSILLGAARTLAHSTRRPNNVLLLFQPAEEGGAGGQKMVQDGVLSGKVLGKPADMIFGLHGWTTLPLGKLATRVGPMMAATNTFEVVLEGRGGHAAAPHTTRDPIAAAAYLVTALQSLASRNADPLDSLVVTVGQIDGGSAVNIIPEFARIRGTVRTLLPETRATIAQRFREVCEGVAQAFGMTASIDWVEGYPVTSNHATAVGRFMEVVGEELGTDSVSDQGEQTMGGEDFSFYGTECPACFFQLGLIPPGEDGYASVHTPQFDFNDDAIPYGIRAMVALAVRPF